MIRPADPERMARELLGRELDELDEEEQDVIRRVAAGSFIGVDAAEAAASGLAGALAWGLDSLTTAEAGALGNTTSSLPASRLAWGGTTDDADSNGLAGA